MYHMDVFSGKPAGEIYMPDYILPHRSAHHSVAFKTLNSFSNNTEAVDIRLPASPSSPGVRTNRTIFKPRESCEYHTAGITISGNAAVSRVKVAITRAIACPPNNQIVKLLRIKST